MSRCPSPVRFSPSARSRFLRGVSLTSLLVLLMSAGGTAGAEESRTAEHDPVQVFAPLQLPDPSGRYRSGSGVPGPDAWQNRADYSIQVRLSPGDRTLSGREVITYTNNSPDTLTSLWLQLDQNLYKEGSRGDFAAADGATDHTDGVTIESVLIGDEGHPVTVAPVISDTRMQIPLPRPMKKGERLKLRIMWHYTVPGPWGGRTAVTSSKNGLIFEIGQFYPRMAVYDDVRGWNTAPYLAQEFYLDYGDFDYSVTVPANFLVAGSGALLNRKEVLTPDEQKRLALAEKSDQPVMIRTQADVESGAGQNGSSQEKTWHFRMNNTRDVAFVASPALLWDAEKMDLPPVSAAPGLPPAPRLAMSVYPAEGTGPHGWDRSTSYVRHAIEYFSKQWYPYPWPAAINVGGHGAGMEYPGIVFDGMNDRDPALFWITTHELGHGWFPMIVGSDERRHAFMDEGFNTFIDALASEHFNHGEFAPKHDPEYSPFTGKPADDILRVLKDRDAPPLMALSDTVSEKYRHNVTYFKSAYGLTLLREQILGPERFDRAFRHYIEAWAFRHPTPSDFFRFMSSEAGEDLSWFWRGWYFSNEVPDYGIGSVSYVQNDPAKGAVVHILNKGGLPLPVTLQVTWMDGSAARIRIPTEAWMLRTDLPVQIAGTQLLRTAVLDPDRAIPDIDRSNNSFGRIPTVAPLQADTPLNGGTQ